MELMLGSVSTHAGYHTVLPCGVKLGMRCLRRGANAFETEFRMVVHHLLKHMSDRLYGEGPPGRDSRRRRRVLCLHERVKLSRYLTRVGVAGFANDPMHHSIVLDEEFTGADEYAVLVTAYVLTLLLSEMMQDRRECLRYGRDKGVLTSGGGGRCPEKGTPGVA